MAAGYRLPPLAFLLSAMLQSGPAAAAASDAEHARVSVQIANPDAKHPLRLFLDRRLIYDGSAAVIARDAPPLVVGAFELSTDGKHTLTSETIGPGSKARLEWSPRLDGHEWIVVRYFAGRDDPPEPPFFVLSLTQRPFFTK